MSDALTTRHPVAAGRYEGRRALLSGGANGLGLATARRLAAEGASVGLIDLDRGAVESASETLNGEGFDATAYAADVTDEDAIAAVVSDFSQGSGSIDALVTMAGIYPWIEFDAMTVADWRNVIEVNLTGTFICAHAVMPLMKDRGYGRIVTISSGTVLNGIAGQSAYISSKAGIIGFTRVLAREGGPAGVTANCLLPGLIATEHVLAMRDDVDDFFAAVVAEQCVPRRGQPGDIADAVAHLCSEGASFISGQSLSVGGGDRFL